MAIVHNRHTLHAETRYENMGDTTRMFLDHNNGRPCAILIFGKWGSEFSVHLTRADAQWLRKVAIEAANHMGATDDDAR